MLVIIMWRFSLVSQRVTARIDFTQTESFTCHLTVLLKINWSLPLTTSFWWESCFGPESWSCLPSGLQWWSQLMFGEHALNRKSVFSPIHSVKLTSSWSVRHHNKMLPVNLELLCCHWTFSCILMWVLMCNPTPTPLFLILTHELSLYLMRPIPVFMGGDFEFKKIKKYHNKFFLKILKRHL